MKRLRHIALNGLAMALWFVCMGTIGLWIRGDNGHADCLRYQSESWPLTEADVSPDTAAGVRLAQARRHWPDSLLTQHVQVGADHGYMFIAHGKGIWPENEPGFSYIDLPRELQPSASYERMWSVVAGPVHMRGWAIPFWAIVIVSGVFPVWRAMSAVIGSVRRFIRGDGQNHSPRPRSAAIQLPVETSSRNRKRRRTRNVLAGVSWLICMGAIELWVRNYMAYMEDRQRFEIASWSITDADIAPVEKSGITLSQMESWLPGLHMSRSVSVGVAKGDLFFAQGTTFWPRSAGGTPQIDFHLVYRPFGRRFWRVNIGTTHMLGFAIPLWAIVLMSGIMPVWVAASYFKEKARRLIERYRTTLQGLCPSCGYDIRATPDLCPECGAVCKEATILSESPVTGS